MQVLELLCLAVVALLIFVALVVLVRKLAYEFYRISFGDPHRVYEFTSNAKIDHYWRSRADRLPGQTLRLYAAWAIQWFDLYIPIIDCERQATKAEYYYTDGWNVGMRAFHFRRVNPEAWPVLLVRRFKGALFSTLPYPHNQQLNRLDECSPSNESKHE